MIDFNKIYSNMFTTLKIPKSFDPAVLFAGFEERYQYLSSYEGLKGLLSKFSQEKLPQNLKDFISEFNLAYEILKKWPRLEIEYEPVIQGTSKHPDFRIINGDLLLYIQVKHMRKSCDFEKKMEENPDSDMWHIVDDESQIRKALKKACGFQPSEKDALYLVAQEISCNADTGDSTHSQAVYGREQFHYPGGFFSRDNSGFFCTEEGRRLCAYITMRRPDNLRFFDNYEKALFINPHFCAQQEKLTAFFDFLEVYDDKKLPDN